jgi:hypothetical protein
VSLNLGGIILIKLKKLFVPWRLGGNVFLNKIKIKSPCLGALVAKVI